MVSDNSLRLWSYIFAGIGVAVSAYLSWVEIAHAQVFCGGSNQCETVANSPYAKIYGVPIAILGLGAYLVIISFLTLENRRVFWFQNSPLIIFGMTLVGTLYSAYLTYLEFAVIHAVCPYCIVSAIAMTILFVISIVRLFRQVPETKPIRTRGG